MRTAQNRWKREWRGIDRALRGDTEGRMKLIEGRDPWAMIAVAVSIIINMLGIAWFAGKFDARQESGEARLTKLEAKAEKDSQQDVQLATIGVQLANIQQGVGEIKIRLEAKQ
jgi:hypothetical protein